MLKNCADCQGEINCLQLNDSKNGERGRNRTYNLLIKSQPVLCPVFSVNHPIHQQLTTSLARTEDPLEMLETLAMFSNVQPHLQPHPY